MKRMTRRENGSVVLCARSVDEALEQLARLEDAMEAVELDGVNELCSILQHAREELGRTVWRRWKRSAPPAVTDKSPRQKGMFCADCARYITSAPGRRSGVCAKYSKRSRKNGVYTTLKGKRPVSGTQPCCGAFVPRDAETAALMHAAPRPSMLNGDTCRCLREWLDMDLETASGKTGIDLDYLSGVEEGRADRRDAELVLMRLCRLAGWSWLLFQQLVLEERPDARS